MGHLPVWFGEFHIFRCGYNSEYQLPIYSRSYVLSCKLVHKYGGHYHSHIMALAWDMRWHTDPFIFEYQILRLGRITTVQNFCWNIFDFGLWCFICCEEGLKYEWLAKKTFWSELKKQIKVKSTSVEGSAWLVFRGILGTNFWKYWIQGQCCKNGLMNSLR